MRGGARVADSGVQARPFRTPSFFFLAGDLSRWPMSVRASSKAWSTGSLIW